MREVSRDGGARPTRNRAVEKVWKKQGMWDPRQRRSRRVGQRDQHGVACPRRESGGHRGLVCRRSESNVASRWGPCGLVCLRSESASATSTRSRCTVAGGPHTVSQAGYARAMSRPSFLSWSRTPPSRTRFILMMKGVYVFFVRQ